jgi:hypothetical protein
MQRRLPEYAQTLPGLCLIIFVAWGSAASPRAVGQGHSLDDPFETSSTLDSHVPRQNLLWQSTVKGYLSDTARLPKTPLAVTPVVAQPAATQPAPVTVADRPTTTPPATTPQTNTAQKGASPSPFSKWISPRSSSTRSLPVPSAEVTPTPVTPHQTVVEPEVALPEATGQPVVEEKPRDLVVVPEVARRTLPARQPSRSTGRRITEVLDQDRTPSAGELAEEEANATPLNGYPVPETAPETDRLETVPVRLAPLTRNQKVIRENVRRVLRYYYDRPLNTRDRSPWEVMHCALSYEVHSRILQGGPQGKPVSAVGWLCFNQSCRRMKLMHVDDEGELNVRVGPALQGHRGQLLAILAQAKVSSEYPMLVDGHEFKIKDLIKAEMETCYPRTELTFKLIGLMHYLDSETQWVNDQGMQWSMRKLVTEEIKQPIRGAACGGTHRLSGLTLAYKTRQARGELVDGEYAQAQRFVAQHQLYTFRTQNPDGSFSTNWFQGREDQPDIDRKLKTTGHMLEWLLYSSTDRELNNPRTIKAVNFLTNLMWQNRYRDWEAGPLGHAIHALVVYDRLTFSKYDTPGDLPMAIRDTTPSGARGTR